MGGPASPTAAVLLDFGVRRLATPIFRLSIFLEASMSAYFAPGRSIIRTSQIGSDRSGRQLKHRIQRAARQYRARHRLPFAKRTVTAIEHRCLQKRKDPNRCWGRDEFALNSSDRRRDPPLRRLETVLDVLVPPEFRVIRGRITENYVRLVEAKFFHSTLQGERVADRRRSRKLM